MKPQPIDPRDAAFLASSAMNRMRAEQRAREEAAREPQPERAVERPAPRRKAGRR